MRARRGASRRERRRRGPSGSGETGGIGAPAADYARLLACLKRSDRPLSIPEIRRQVGLAEELEPRLRIQMELLEKQGVVFSHRRGRWTMHSRARVVIGRLSSPRRTYGFVTPEETGGRDLYIAGRRMHAARHGDLVLARASGPSPRGGGPGSLEGEILAVLERRPPYAAGIYHGGPDGGSVIPRDDRIASEIVVGRPGAPAVDGSVVWVEITSPEDRLSPAKGRILSVLGRPEDPGVDAKVIERTWQLPGRFTEEALRRAASLGPEIEPSDRTGREDFTATLVVTVDPATARDHDDAVGLERIETARGWVNRLAVHIADVSHYVAEGDPIDAEARRRGTSVYFPGSSIPMIPETLSSSLCSLLPGRDRLTQSVLMDFDDAGRRLDFRFADGVIRSAASLTYGQLEETIGGAAGTEAALSAMTRRMADLCRALRARRMRRGSLDLNLPETEVVVDGEGRPVELRVVRRTVAHEIIEEFMLSANETVAEYLNLRAADTLYRIHEDPDPAEIDKLEEELRAMGLPARRTRGPASSRIRSLLDACRGRPEEPAIAMMVLRSLKLARYSHEAAGHFGLAAPLYTHFTSPIRRYPDLVVHRILRAQRRTGHLPPAGGTEIAERLAAVAEECSRLERRAEEAERAMVDWKTAVYMKERVGTEHHGTVTGITAGALFVTLDGLGVEGMVPLRTDRARSERARRGDRAPADRPAMRYRPGERLRVRVTAVDVFRGRVILRPLSTG